MNISGKENVIRAIERREPAYPPIYIELEPAHLREQDAQKLGRIRALQAQAPNDILVLPLDAGYIEPPAEKDGVRRWLDHWGTGWVDDGKGATTDIHPLEQGYEALSNYAFPDPHKTGLFVTANALRAQRPDNYLVGAVWFSLFERLWMLRGFDNMLVDPMIDPESFSTLRDRIVEHDLVLIDRWADYGVNAVYFSDDWGTQSGLLIAPDFWRETYKPSYARLFKRVHDAGMHVWMHLCGNITAILPDLIEVGLDVLNPIQPRAMDVRQLAREFGGKVCFFGGADVQGTLVTGTPEDVKREARFLMETLGAFNGGYIASTSHGFMPETPLDNIIALYEAFMEFSPRAV